MICEDALNFLKSHQPMPRDEDMPEELIKKYEETRNFFASNPDERCIPLFLHSFGDKDGYGVYQLVDELIRLYDKEIVIPYLLEVLKNGTIFEKYWTVQISSYFIDQRLLESLMQIVLKEKDVDLLFITIGTLEAYLRAGINREEILIMLGEQYKKVYDEELRELIGEVINDN